MLNLCLYPFSLSGLLKFDHELWTHFHMFSLLFGDCLSWHVLSSTFSSTLTCRHDMKETSSSAFNFIISILRDSNVYFLSAA